MSSTDVEDSPAENGDEPLEPVLDTGNPTAMLVRHKVTGVVTAIGSAGYKGPSEDWNKLGSIDLFELMAVTEFLMSQVKTKIIRHRSDRRSSDSEETIIRFRLVTEDKPHGQWVTESQLRRRHYNQVKRQYMMQLKRKKSLRSFNFVLSKCPTFQHLVLD